MKEAEKKGEEFVDVNDQFATETIEDPGKSAPPDTIYSVEEVKEYTKAKWKWRLVEELDG